MCDLGRARRFACALRLRKGDVTALLADALATSSNAALSGNLNPSYWRFAGKENANGRVHELGGPELAAACQRALALNGQGIPFVMTRELRRRLGALGFSTEEVGQLRPAHAHRIVSAQIERSAHGSLSDAVESAGASGLLAGQAIVTAATGRLQHKHVVHVVAPYATEEGDLRQTYFAAYDAAAGAGARSLAMHPIGARARARDAGPQPPIGRRRPTLRLSPPAHAQAAGSRAIARRMRRTPPSPPSTTTAPPHLAP